MNMDPAHSPSVEIKARRAEDGDSEPSSAADPDQALGISSVGHTLAALYRLLIADLKLSANGLGHALYYAALALLFIAFAGLFGSALLVLGLTAMGLSWVAALAVTTLLSIVLAGSFWLLSRRALSLTGLDASQRQVSAVIAALSKD